MRSGAALLTILVALAVGVAIGYVDSQPGWDDTGITAGSVLLSAAILAAVRPRVAWAVGLAVGTPVLLFNVALRDSPGSAVAIGIGLVGAGVGYLIGRAAGFGRKRRPA